MSLAISLGAHGAQGEVFESNPGVRYIAGTPGRASSGQAWAYGMPATFGSSTVASYKYSICANYTVEDEQPQVTLIGNPYMYTARAYDIETGLYYYRARYYNPHIGRFLQVDPAGQGMNWYAYCGNNSINCVDPTGQISLGGIGLGLPVITIGAVDASTISILKQYHVNDRAIVQNAIKINDPCFALATGNVMILNPPWDPKQDLLYDGIGAALKKIQEMLGIKMNLGTVFNLYNKEYLKFAEGLSKWFITPVVTSNPALSIVKQYLQVMALLPSVIKNAVVYPGRYRAFIQIQVYKCTKDEETGDIDYTNPKEYGKPYYLEIIHCKGWEGIYKSGLVSHDYGYLTQEDAWNAAINGMIAWKYDVIGGKYAENNNYPNAFLGDWTKILTYDPVHSIFGTVHYYTDVLSVFLGDIPK